MPVNARGMGSASGKPPSAETLQRRMYDCCGALVRAEAVKLADAHYIVEEDIDLVVANCLERYDAAVAS